MNRKTITILINGDKIEAWGNLREACQAHGLSYWTIVKKDLPLEYDGWMIHRVKFKDQSLIDKR